MCRSHNDPCGSRRCARPDGFTETESDLRNTSRNLGNAQGHLEAGDAQAAANSLARAAAAHRSASGVSMGGPTQDPTAVAGPVRDFQVSPGDVPTAIARVEQINLQREKVGLAPMGIDVTRQYTPVDGDPIMAYESNTVRVYGASPEELSRVSLGNVRSEPERKVKTMAVLEASVAATRASGGRYISRQEGVNSIPSQVDRYIAAAPGSPERARIAPTQEDKSEAARVRMWVRTQQPTSAYLQSLRHSVAEEYMSVREAGVASSALNGYLQHRERTRRAAAQYEAEKQRVGAAAGGQPIYSPRPQGSRWLGTRGQKYTMVATVLSQEPIYNEYSTQPQVVYTMRTPEGDLLRWKASSPAGLREGDSVTFEGKVKDHSTFQQEKQTEVWYCKNFRLHQPQNAATA